MMAASSNSELKDDIRKALAKAGASKLSPAVLSQCVALASTLHLSAEQMAESWEAFSINRNSKSLDETSFKSYRLAVIKESDNADHLLPDVPSSSSTITGAVVTRPDNKRQSSVDKDGIPHVTPVGKDKKPRVSLSPEQQQTKIVNTPKYQERKKAGTVVQTFNPDLQAKAAAAAAAAAVSSTPKCTVEYDCYPTNVKSSYRHMFTTLDERALALDGQLEELGNVMIERYGLGAPTNDVDDNGDNVAALEAVGVPRQEKICCIGRICNAAHEGRMNATTVLLEGSRDVSGGARVELDLSHLTAANQSFSLFPGQIVAVEGMNASGRKLVAHRICEGAAHPPEKSSVKELLRYHHEEACQGGVPLKLMSVCGPYTSKDNHDFAPLLDLVNVVQTEKPDVVILAGPFVDMRHDAVKDGQTPLQFEDGGQILVPSETYFSNRVATLIEDLYSSTEGIQTQFVLVPSVDDAVAESVYPQPPLKSDSKGRSLNLPGAEGIEFGTLGLHHIETAGRSDGKSSRRVHCVSNPCTLKINEVVVGITSNDVLFHMNAGDTSANLGMITRLPRLAQHLLQQQSYNPLFPASTAINPDMKQREKWKMPCLPDILILPSRLTHLCKTALDSTLVLNPGYLTRGTTGGTYAVMDIHPFDRDTLDNAGGEDVQLEHGVPQRTRVEIRRI